MVSAGRRPDSRRAMVVLDIETALVWWANDGRCFAAIIPRCNSDKTMGII